jgi:hypothetical protein
MPPFRSVPMRIVLFSLLLLAIRTEAQSIPSNEDFVNAVFPKVFGLDSFPSLYNLIAGSDTCRFEKFDYDEWVKYYEKETVPFTILNELAYKVHTAHQPYFWQQAKLQNATLLTARQADSIFYSLHTEFPGVFSFSQPQFTDDGQYAVIDINMKTGIISGVGYTFLFRHAPDGWRRIGEKQNWGDLR